MRSNGVHLTEGMDDSGGVMDGISSVVSSVLSTSVWGCSMFMFTYDEHTEAIMVSPHKKSTTIQNKFFFIPAENKMFRGLYFVHHKLLQDGIRA